MQRATLTTFFFVLGCAALELRVYLDVLLSAYTLPSLDPLVGFH